MTSKIVAVILLLCAAASIGCVVYQGAMVTFHPVWYSGWTEVAARVSPWALVSACALVFLTRVPDIA